MKKMHKKFWAGALALSLTFALSVPALAAGGEGSSTGTGKDTFNIISSLNMPTLSYEIKSDGKIIANPYKIQCTITNASGLENDDTKDTVLGVPALITNNSDVAIDVAATATGTSSSEALKLCDDETAFNGLGATEKGIYLSLALENVEDSNCTVPSSVTNPWTTNTTQVKTSTGTGDNAAKITLAAKAANPTYGAYKFTGKSQGAWTSEDKITVNVIFKVTATIATAP